MDEEEVIHINGNPFDDLMQLGRFVEQCTHENVQAIGLTVYAELARHIILQLAPAPNVVKFKPEVVN